MIDCHSFVDHGACHFRQDLASGTVACRAQSWTCWRANSAWRPIYSARSSKHAPSLSSYNYQSSSLLHSGIIFYCKIEHTPPLKQLNLVKLRQINFNTYYQNYSRSFKIQICSGRYCISNCTVQWVGCALNRSDFHTPLPRRAHGQ